MSVLVTRPWAPVPSTSCRSTPSLAAMLRTSGLENLRSRSASLSSPLEPLARPESPPSRPTAWLSCAAAEAAAAGAPPSGAEAGEGRRRGPLGAGPGEGT
jgi:hypothetical protein